MSKQNYTNYTDFDTAVPYTKKADSIASSIKARVLSLVQTGCDSALHIRKGLQSEFGQVDYAHINTALEQLEIDGEIWRDNTGLLQKIYAANDSGKTKKRRAANVADGGNQTKRFEIKPRTSAQEKLDKGEREMPKDMPWQKRLDSKIIEQCALAGLSKALTATRMGLTPSQLQSAFDNFAWVRAAWSEGEVRRALDASRTEAEARAAAEPEPKKTAIVPAEPMLSADEDALGAPDEIPVLPDEIPAEEIPAVRQDEPLTEAATATKKTNCERVTPEIVEENAANGLSLSRAAAALGIPEGSYTGYVYKKPELRAALERGKARFKAQPAAPLKTPKREPIKKIAEGSAAEAEAVRRDTDLAVSVAVPRSEVEIIGTALETVVPIAAEHLSSIESYANDARLVFRKLKLEREYQELYSEPTPKAQEVWSDVERMAA